jgi:hypothetical protein
MRFLFVNGAAAGLVRNVEWPVPVLGVSDREGAFPQHLLVEGPVLFASTAAAPL